MIHSFCVYGDDQFKTFTPGVLQLELWNSPTYEAATEIGRRICDRILWPDPDQWLVPRIVTNFPVKSSPTLLDTATASLSMLYRNHHHRCHRYLFIKIYSILVRDPPFLSDCCVSAVREQRLLWAAKISLSDPAPPPLVLRPDILCKVTQIEEFGGETLIHHEILRIFFTSENILRISDISSVWNLGLFSSFPISSF